MVGRGSDGRRKKRTWSAINDLSGGRVMASRFGCWVQRMHRGRADSTREADRRVGGRALWPHGQDAQARESGGQRTAHARGSGAEPAQVGTWMV
jgi:hypothetical protein